MVQDAPIGSPSNVVAENDLFARFSVGDLHCVALRDGQLDAPPALLAPEVPVAEVRSFLQARGEDVDALKSPITCLFVQLPDQRRILIDSGLGKVPRPGGPPLDTVGRLPAALAAAAIDPASIGDVLVSHIHPDHIGGLFDVEGRPSFPQATYHVPRGEAAFWGQEQPDLSGTLMPPPMQAGVVGSAKRFLALAADHIVLFEAGQAVIEGVSSMPLPGHTPGQVGFLIDGGSQSLFYSADAAGHQNISVEKPEWRFANDSDSPVAVETRKRLVALLADKGWTSYTPHFTWPGVGRVVRTDAGIRWQPIR